MAETIKVRSSRKGESVDVRLLIRHNMEVGGRRKSGERVAPHFIKQVECSHNDEIVMLAHWGAGIAKNPYLAFSFDGAKKGDKLKIAWVDNQGAKDEITTRID